MENPEKKTPIDAIREVARQYQGPIVEVGPKQQRRCDLCKNRLDCWLQCKDQGTWEPEQ